MVDDQRQVAADATPTPVGGVEVGASCECRRFDEAGVDVEPDRPDPDRTWWSRSRPTCRRCTRRTASRGLIHTAPAGSRLWRRTATAWLDPSTMW